jgi:hypothetical protein
MTRFLALASALIALAVVCPAFAQEQDPMLSQRIIMIFSNMAKDDQVAEGIERMEKAAKAGFTHVLLNDSKFVKWDKQDKSYFDNVKKVHDKAAELKLKIIAAVGGVGYSNDLLSRDPNLAEGLPVVDAPFVVKDGTLVPAVDNLLQNGTFQADNGKGSPTGWTVDQPGKISFIDRDVQWDGKPSLRMQEIGLLDPHGRGRLLQTIKVTPFHYYHVSMMVKAEGYPGKEKIGISPNGKGGPLNFERIILKDKQDWMRVDNCFNTLDNSTIDFYIGTWAGNKTGKIWIADVKVEPAGFVNVLRRDGTPLKVTSKDGTTTYVEGKDFDEIKDPRLGNDPRLGCYTSWHDQPVVHIPKGSAIKEGDQVLASYYHCAVTASEQVTCCMSDPKLMEIEKWHFEQVHKYVQPDGGYLLGHDEIRVQGWDYSCQKTGLSCGDILAKNVSECVEALNKEDPGKPLYMLNDLFDPNHNAHKAPYWLVKGPNGWDGSWKALPKNAIIVNWMGFGPERIKSMKFFEDRGFKQILAGYYDSPDFRKNIASWLQDASANDIKGVIGVAYFTWSNNFNDMGAFVEAARNWQKTK